MNNHERNKTNQNFKEMKKTFILMATEVAGTCPECGSEDTGQSTYADWCNACGWSFGY